VEAGVVHSTRALFGGGKSHLSETVSLGCKSEVCFVLGDWHEIHSTKEDKGLCLQNGQFFGTIKAVEQEMVLGI